MTDFVTESVRQFAESLLPTMDLELYDVQYRREGSGWVLRIIIDSENGVTLEDCSQVSRETSDFLDVEDLIEHAYNLEVSSPGVERTLRSLEECFRFLGQKVRIKVKEVKEGERVFVGELSSVEDDQLYLIAENGETYSFSWDQVKKARLSL